MLYPGIAATRKYTEVKNKVGLVLAHILGWVILLSIPSIFSMGKAIRVEMLFQNVHDFKILLSWILLIAFSYLNHLVLVPEFYLKRQFGAYIVLVLIGFAALFLLPQLVGLFWAHTPPPNMGAPPPDKPSEVMENSHFVLFFFVGLLASINYHTRLQLANVEKQRFQTELENLKAQIQPHFLFNTLNSIYSLAIRKDDKTADTVVQLSSFLRYVIQDAQGNEVELAKEIAYLNNYLDLQRSRLRESVTIDFEVKGKVGQQRIAPLILFSFIENAFQHGVSPEEESVIQIVIQVEAQELTFSCYNRKVATQAPKGTGIGLQNTRKRLELLYPSRHHLVVMETGEDYQVELSIRLS